MCVRYSTEEEVPHFCLMGIRCRLIASTCYYCGHSVNCFRCGRYAVNFPLVPREMSRQPPPAGLYTLFCRSLCNTEMFSIAPLQNILWPLSEESDCYYCYFTFFLWCLLMYVIINFLKENFWWSATYDWGVCGEARMTERGSYGAREILESYRKERASIPTYWRNSLKTSTT